MVKVSFLISENSSGISIPYRELDTKYPYVLFNPVKIKVQVCCINNSPFDFSEGERELVSGLNIKYVTNIIDFSQ